MNDRLAIRNIRSRGIKLTEHYPSPITPLADPPSGSGLSPVMGDQGLPFIGRGLAVLDDALGFIQQRYDRFGSVSWTGVMGTRAVLAVGPDATEEILTNRGKVFANGPAWEYFIGPFFHRGLMLLDFEEHLHHKRIMQQGFTRTSMERYQVLLDEGVRRGIAKWREAPDFMLYEAIKQLLLDLATEVFVGEELGPQSNQIDAAFIDTVVAGLGVVRTDVPGTRWHRGLKGRRLLEDYFRSKIPKKRNGGGDDLFSVLCRARDDDGATFTDDDIVNHMIFLLMAAHDTSTISASTVAHYLGKDQALRRRMRGEADALGKERLTYEDFEQLPLLELAFKEALRINPPVGMVMRQALSDTSIQGQFVPAGTKILLAVLGTHRLPDIWPRPDEFDPDRFAPHRREDRIHRFAWCPFGGGVHKCIGLHFGGMQVKTILYHLLRSYDWHVDPQYVPPMDYGTGLHPADGLPVHLEPLVR